MFRRIFSTIARRVASSHLLLALIIVLQVLYLLPVLKQATMGGWQDSIASTEVESIRMYRSSQSLDLNGYPEDDAVGSWHRANDIKMAQAADKLLDRWDAGDANGYFAAAAVGKSTLMTLLSKSEVFAENKLFATLDTTVRKVIIENLPFLLSDTVGFIRKLPTDLVDSFKSTLDEVREADLLLHIVDISHPDFEEQIEVVNKTLADIGAAGKPMILVFNKIDAYTYIEKAADDLTPRTKENLTLEELMKTWMAKMEDNCLFISAREKINMEELKSVVYQRVKELHVQKYPYNDFLYQTYEEEV